MAGLGSCEIMLSCYDLRKDRVEQEGERSGAGVGVCRREWEDECGGCPGFGCLRASGSAIEEGPKGGRAGWPDLDGKTRIFGDHVDMGCFEWRPVIEAALDIKPDTLNPKSKGQYVSVYIELPAGKQIADIDIPSLRLNGTIEPAERQPATGDYDADGIPDLMVKFGREALCGLSPGEQIITLTGSCLDGADLTGQDTIRVLAK